MRCWSPLASTRCEPDRLVSVHPSRLSAASTRAALAMGSTVGHGYDKTGSARQPLASQARHSAFTSAICRGVAQEACTSRGLATMTAIARARDVATFSRRGS
jgi:hypothetical protein